MAIADFAIATLVIAGSGSATYAASISESASAADTVASGGIFGRAVSETATAVGTVAAGGVQSASVSEVAAALDSITLSTAILVSVYEASEPTDIYTVTSPFHEYIEEFTAPSDEYDVVQYRQTWFLSFERVVPAPTGQGGGATGELFGQTRLQIYPPRNRRQRP